ALNHEALDHAVKDRPVVERLFVAPARPRIRPLSRALGQADEVRDRVRRFGLEQACREIAFARRKMRQRHRYLLALGSRLLPFGSAQRLKPPEPEVRTAQSPKPGA